MLEPWGENTPGVSHRREIQPSGAITNWEPKTTTLNPNVVAPAVDTSACYSGILLTTAGNYPYVSMSPSIDISTSVKFYVIAKDTVKIDVAAAHDQFPFYEFVLVINGKRTLLASYESPWSGPRILSLNLRAYFSGTMTISAGTECE